jgi:hypothetical protein
VLHTDEPHPHVHMVVKAVSEHGVRLNIRRATRIALSIKVNEVAAGHGKFGGVVDVLVRGASRVRSRSRITFSRLS